MTIFYGKDGIFARLFSNTIEQMLEMELMEKLGYELYDAEGRNSGNSRNGHYTRKMRTSGGDAEIRVPRDRIGEFNSVLLKKNSNEIEQKVIVMYGKGTSTRDIRDMLHDSGHRPTASASEIWLRQTPLWRGHASR